MIKSYPTIIPGLRSPSDQIAGIVYFGRMIDKIRLQQDNNLPEDWLNMLGDQHKGGFDYRCCKFLRISYSELVAKVISGAKDFELLEWAFTHGHRPSEEEIDVWNGFMMKRGWRDEASKRLAERLEEIGLKSDTVATFFEFIDLDEGRLKQWRYV